MPYSTVYSNSILLILTVSLGLSGCYKKADVPTSLLPYGCRVAQINNIDSTSQHSYDYQYDRLGNRTIERFDKAITRVFTFDTNGLYILSQQTNNVTLDYQYDAPTAPRRINRISGGSFNYVYTYEGENIKTYVSTEGGVTRTYSFTNGKLTGLTTNPETAKFDINAEKITKYTDSQGNTINYNYDGSGQVVRAEYIYTTGAHTLVTYAYDDKKHYSLGWLLARGFPGSAASGQPGPGLDAFGESIQVNNLLKVTTQVYKTSAATETPTTRVLTYQHQYNHEGYSLGFARSDGTRVRYVYANCTNE